MTYEIPQQLQHKEKILFGLTFTQLGWATLFCTIILIIFSSNNTIYIKCIYATIPTIIGASFVLFDVSTWIKYVIFFARFRNADLMNKKMQKLLGIKDIKDSTVYAEKELAILEITPINFFLKNTENQEQIIYGFQKFLNSLEFPVQLLVATKTINLEDYMKLLEKRTTNKKLYDDFKEFLNTTILKKGIRTRFFYIIIPKHTSLEIQSQICIDKLQSIGLQVTRLNDNKLVRLYHDYFNDNNTRPIVEHIDNDIHYLLAPKKIIDYPEYFKINEKYCRIITATGYPRTVIEGFLDKIISSNDDCDISMHIEPYPIDTMMIILNRELQKQRADLYAEEQKHSINPSLEIKYHDTRKVLEELQKGNEKLYNIALYINCKAETKSGLDLLTKKVEAELQSIMIIPNIPLFRQMSGYKSITPLGIDNLKIKRNIATRALSAFFPFTSTFLNIDQNGVMLGLNKNNIPYIKDIYKLSNANGIILATSGAGKSYFAKLFIARQLLNKTKVIVIDPQTEYLGLIKQCKGELITISKNSETIINPLDLMGHDLIEKRLALMDIFKIMFGELTEIQKSILDKAVNETYSRKGIRVNSYEHKAPPTLTDLYKVLKEMDNKASSMEKITYRALINRLYMYTEGVFNFLDKQSHIQYEKDFVCFNIGEMPKQVKPIIMFLILDYVFMKMKSSKERKLLVIDEAWALLGHAEEASYIFEIVKTCRKYNMGLLLITQDVQDIISSQAGHAVLANTAYTLLLRQKPAVIDSIVKTFQLSTHEKEYLITATQGKGILILDNEHQEIEVIASPKEHEQITTNPDEILHMQKKTVEDRTNIDIELDTNKDLYYGKDLDLEQKNYLHNHEYEAGYFVPIGKPNQEECWIKTNKIESIAHTFLVQNIKQEIEKYTTEVQVNITQDADITFENKKGETIAIEVETGTSYKKNKTELLNKFHEAKLKYKKKLYIVLTDRRYKPIYKDKFKDTQILLRQDIPEIIDAQCSDNYKAHISAKNRASKKPKKHKLTYIGASNRA